MPSTKPKYFISITFNIYIYIYIYIYTKKGLYNTYYDNYVSKYCKKLPNGEISCPCGVDN